MTFTVQIVRNPSGWWAHVWIRDHIEYLGPYRWRWLARWRSLRAARASAATQGGAEALRRIDGAGATLSRSAPAGSQPRA